MVEAPSTTNPPDFLPLPQNAPSALTVDGPRHLAALLRLLCLRPPDLRSRGTSQCPATACAVARDQTPAASPLGLQGLGEPALAACP